MLLIGYLLSVLTGLVLGILGGGGSMMILPIFVYIFMLEPALAVTYSLFVVGIASFFGASSHYKQGNVNLKIVLYFGLPSVISVILTRNYILASIPDPIIDFKGIYLSKAAFLLMFFATMMLFTAYSMIKNRNAQYVNKKNDDIRWLALSFEGFVVGLVTGLVGAGGGFLIIPALLYFAKIPMKQAIGTSLSIIAINTLIGFFSSFYLYQLDWSFIGIFTVLTTIGILIGSQLSKRIKAQNLKLIFGYFILIVAIYIITKELL